MLVVAHIFQVGMRHSSVSLRFRLFYHPHIRATPMYSCVYLYKSHISLFTALCFLLFLFSHWNNGKNRWELDTSAKQETWQGSLWGQRKIVDIFGKKSTPYVSRNRKFSLVERRQVSSHHLDSGRSELSLGAFSVCNRCHLWLWEG